MAGTTTSRGRNSRTRLTQKERIINRLVKGGTLTQAQAERMGIMSLSSRVNELRKDGHAILSNPYRTRDNRTVVRYALAA